jgi:hypothetical protein
MASVASIFLLAVTHITAGAALRLPTFDASRTLPKPRSLLVRNQNNLSPIHYLIVMLSKIKMLHMMFIEASTGP